MDNFKIILFHFLDNLLYDKAWEIDEFFQYLFVRSYLSSGLPLN